MTLDQQNTQLYEMLTAVVQSLVDLPEDVVIDTKAVDTSLTFYVRANPTDLGKLIGVNGRTARALRIILSANAARLKRNLSLDIREIGRVDDDGFVHSES